ncbi:hypothetical protein [Gluconobacter sp. Dm-62]|uniref:hypothetical protein n=1 Tax=Gluconobacter sp. Dm-62 TaxID=2799804 RepID=UPI001B8D195A|nr:hypothetical protein [Gluconobacter sp. Dm-62]
MDLNNLDNEKYHDFELKIYLRTLDYSDYEKNTMIRFANNDYHPDSIISIPSNDECQNIGECWDVLEKNYVELSGQREFFKAWYANEFMKIIKEHNKSKNEMI